MIKKKYEFTSHILTQLQHITVRRTYFKTFRSPLISDKDNFNQYLYRKLVSRELLYRYIKKQDTLELNSCKECIASTSSLVIRRRVRTFAI